MSVQKNIPGGLSLVSGIYWGSYMGSTDKGDDTGVTDPGVGSPGTFVVKTLLGTQVGCGGCLCWLPFT